MYRVIQSLPPDTHNVCSMKAFGLLVGCIMSMLLAAQEMPVGKDSSGKVRQSGPGGKPEIFTSGFIDIINNGQVNASARFIRLYLGEPGKFNLPVSFYSGVSSNNFQQSPVLLQQGNETLYTHFINPLSGLANLSVEGIWLIPAKKQKLTRTGFVYHAAERVLTGMRAGPLTDPLAGKPVNFLNSVGALGLYFQTGAWEKSNNKNMGLSWLAMRYITSFSAPSAIRGFLPDIQTNGLYNGWSVAWGVEITRLVNIRVVYYKYNKFPELGYYHPLYQFSFNYALK